MKKIVIAMLVAMGLAACAYYGYQRVNQPVDPGASILEEIATGDGRGDLAAPATKRALYQPRITVFRPSEADWIDIDPSELHALDLWIKDGHGLHLNAAFDPSSGQIAAARLGPLDQASLQRHRSTHSPGEVVYPASDAEFVYARWEGSDVDTFQPLGHLGDGATFFYLGREFLTVIDGSGHRQVKPTGIVMSEVTAVWSEQHDNQIHLTLFYPDLDETAKIVTTHKHPFYVPGTEEWIAAENLKIGMGLETCNGVRVRVEDWVLIDEPFTAYNITVADTHTYFVKDPNNPRAPPVLVHNDCDPAKLIGNGGKQLDDDTIIGANGNRFKKKPNGTYEKVGLASVDEINAAGIPKSNWVDSKLGDRYTRLDDGSIQGPDGGIAFDTGHVDPNGNPILRRKSGGHYTLDENGKQLGVSNPDPSLAAYTSDINCVYLCRDADGVIRYVGITDDIDRRGREHLKTAGLEPRAIDGLSNLSRSDTRAVEQVLINHYGLRTAAGRKQLTNSINALSRVKNPTKYENQLKRGAELLKKVGYKFE